MQLSVTNPSEASAPLKILCREIVDADRDAVVATLTRGFPARTQAYWEHALTVLADRPLPDACPRYGYALTADREIVGVILMIFSQTDPQQAPRCNISSWFVDPRFRSYASLMISMAVRRKEAVYINISPVSQTRQTITAQGFSCYAQGVYIALGALAPWRSGVTIREAGTGMEADDRVSRLLTDHAAYGCLSLVCCVGVETFPFVFLRRRVPKTILPCAQLVFCDDMADFVRFAGPLSRYLLLRGMPLVLLDANEKIDGLPGVYFAGRAAKYFRGWTPPRLGDLSYSEAVLFGP